ncbi:unnamed protein product [[Candida] boidinii]|nr:unnamed protein product [[Candida] boidinii]
MSQSQPQTLSQNPSLYTLGQPNSCYVPPHLAYQQQQQQPIPQPQLQQLQQQPIPQQQQQPLQLQQPLQSTAQALPLDQNRYASKVVNPMSPYGASVIQGYNPAPGANGSK